MCPYGDLAQRKTDYWRTNKGKNLKKIANPQAFSVEQFVFSYFWLKMSLYIVLEAKYVRNWKSEIHWWAHYLVRNKKMKKFGMYRPCSLVSDEVAPQYQVRAQPWIKRRMHPCVGWGGTLYQVKKHPLCEVRNNSVSGEGQPSIRRGVHPCIR